MFCTNMYTMHITTMAQESIVFLVVDVIVVVVVVIIVVAVVVVVVFTVVTVVVANLKTNLYNSIALQHQGSLGSVLYQHVHHAHNNNGPINDCC